MNRYLENSYLPEISVFTPLYGGTLSPYATLSFTVASTTDNPVQVFPCGVGMVRLERMAVT